MPASRLDELKQNVHAPLQQLEDTFFAERGIEVWVKREDLIHPFISGNKWRKLKYNLLEAAAQNKTELLTFGGAYSNHLLATACAAATFGFGSVGIVRGDERPQNYMLSLCEAFGMQLHFVSREGYRDKEALATRYASAHTYTLPEGGSNYLAVQGCAELVDDIKEAFDHVLLAAGTGGTTAGVAQGFARHFPQTQVHGIAVLKGADFLKDEIEQLVPGLHNWTLHTSFHEGGYGKTSDELLQLIRHMATNTGILFDQVYTGKMLLAARRLAAQGLLGKGSRVLLIHTGGTLGYLSQV